MIEISIGLIVGFVVGALVMFSLVDFTLHPNKHSKRKGVGK
jgi:hypothetical protein